MFIATCRCQTGILGLGGGGGGGGVEASNNKLKDTSFIFPMPNVTVLGVFRTLAQKEYGKVLEIKSTYILNILTLLFFQTSYVTLTYDLVSRIILSGAYCLYYFR